MATATTTSPVVATPQTVATALQSILTAAQADLAAPDSTPDSQAAARTLIAYVQSALIRQAATPGPAGTGSAPTVTIRGVDTVFSVAKAHLGDVARYGEILDLSGLDFINLPPGTVLQIPPL